MILLPFTPPLPKVVPPLLGVFSNVGAFAGQTGSPLPFELFSVRLSELMPAFTVGDTYVLIARPSFTLRIPVVISHSAEPQVGGVYTTGVIASVQDRHTHRYNVTAQPIGKAVRANFSTVYKEGAVSVLVSRPCPNKATENRHFGRMTPESAHLRRTQLDSIVLKHLYASLVRGGVGIARGSIPLCGSAYLSTSPVKSQAPR